MTSKLFAASILFVGLVSAPAVALAGDATGTWTRSDGTSKVRIAPCGGALCGTVSWVKDPARQSSVGKQVFFNMKPSGDNSWKGKAFNPEDGKTYTGKMTLSGNSLTTAGCVMGGLICRSVSWRR